MQEQVRIDEKKARRKIRLCRWLFRHRLFWLCRKVSVSIYSLLIGEEMVKGFVDGLEGHGTRTGK